MFNPYSPYGQTPQYMPQYMQPQGQSMQAMQPIQPSGLNRVTGADGARAFTMPPNSVVPLFDDTRDVFYIKTTDSGGFPTLKAYRFVPLEDEPAAAPVVAAGMSREEIQQMVREEIEAYGKQFVPVQPVPAEPAAKRRAAAEPPAAVPAVRTNDAGT